MKQTNGLSLEDTLMKIENLKRLLPEGAAARQEHGDGKMQDAIKSLVDIYDSCRWYSARYEAGRAIGMGSEELHEDMRSWLQELSEKIMTPEKVESIYYEKRVNERYRFSSTKQGEEERKKHERKMSDLDIGRYNMRYESDNEMREISPDLKHIYNNVPFKDVRAMAGQILRYSKARIWLDESIRTIRGRH